MKDELGRWLVLLAVAGAASLVCAAPPLRVSKNAPRLDSAAPPANPSSTSAPPKKRLICYDCHANYLEEPIAVAHAKENITCVKCHGESTAHSNDEENITPPNRMYPAARIDSMCRECHETHEASARKIIACWQKRCPQKTDPSQLVCTDCHGEHRLKNRTVHWDKSTGQLIAKSPAATGKP